MIDLNFPHLTCKKCGSINQTAVIKGARYGIYCKDCGAFIKWADDHQKAVIIARKDWLKEHDKI